MKTINADEAFELFFHLMKAMPWLNQGGIMQAEKDAHAEEEAIVFLRALCGGKVSDWGDCSPAARRVVNSLIIDFMSKLCAPYSSISRSRWQVPVQSTQVQQALAVIQQAIERGHGLPPAVH